MIINKEHITNSISQALKEGTDWAMRDTGRDYSIMIDTGDAHIWTDVFIDCNTCKTYHSDSIHILRGNGYHCEDAVKSLTDEAVQLLAEAGWDVVDDKSAKELILEGAPEFTRRGEIIPLGDNLFADIASYMSDSIREELAGEAAICECSNEIFLINYLKRDPGFTEVLYSIFDIEF